MKQKPQIVLLCALCVFVCYRQLYMSLGLLMLPVVLLSRLGSSQEKAGAGPHKKRRSLFLAVLMLLACALYYVVFYVLAESQGYRPPSIPIHILQQQQQQQLHQSNTNVTNDDNLLTVFLIDGLRADVLEEELLAGNLPAIQKLADQGCRIRNVIAPFPSITGYAYWPLMTGMEATRSGHFGTRYLDRRTTTGNWKNHYGPASVNFEAGFTPNVTTLFEASAQRYPDQWTLVGNSMLHRGANVTYVASLEQYFSKLLHKWWLPQLLRRIPVLQWLAPDFYDFEKRFLKRILHILDQGKPRVVWTVFPSTDNAAHARGVHKEYHLVLRSIDEAIGNYVQAIQKPNRKNSYKSYTFAVISDHGEANVDIDGGGNLDLCEAFVPKGIRAWRGNAKAWSSKFDEPIETFGADKDLIIGIQGDASGSVYVRSHSQRGWLDRVFEDELRHYHQVPDGRPDVDILQTALDYKGIELVAWSRQNGLVGVQTKSPSGIISDVGVIQLQEDGRISYRVEGLRCPFGYGPELADNTPRSAREWLDLTVDTHFPYALVRLIQSLTVPGLAPDMIVTAQEGYDLGKDWEYFIINFAGGHGGINQAHLRTPAIFSGEGVVGRGDVLNVATAEDVGASLHGLLRSSQGQDGLHLLHQLEPSESDLILRAASQSINGGTANHAEQLLSGTPVSCLAR